MIFFQTYFSMEERIMEIPMITEPIIIPNATFWSSSISFRMEKGDRTLINQIAIPKKLSPIEAYKIVSITTAIFKFSCVNQSPIPKLLT